MHFAMTNSFLSGKTFLNNGFNVHFSPSAVGLTSEKWAKVYLYITPQPQLQLNRLDKVFPIIIQISDSSSPIHSANTTIAAMVSNNCIFKPPTLVVEDNLKPIPLGRPAHLVVNLNITNNDFGNCSASNFQLSSGLPSPGNGWSSQINPSYVTNLMNNHTSTSHVLIISRENILPGDYQILFQASDGYQQYHTEFTSISLSVTCPNPPRPASKLNAQTIVPFFSFGLQAGPVFLTWEACLTTLWCCCPCK